MEQITKHWLLDVYRITDGVLLNVKKYEVDRMAFHTLKESKKSFDKLNGLKNLYRANEDIKDKYSDKFIFKCGEYYYDNFKIIPTSDVDKFRFEIKTTGESFSGNSEIFTQYLSEISYIMSRY